MDAPSARRNPLRMGSREDELHRGRLYTDTRGVPVDAECAVCSWFWADRINEERDPYMALYWHLTDEHPVLMQTGDDSCIVVIHPDTPTETVRDRHVRRWREGRAAF